jgi:hypothetical protein
MSYRNDGLEPGDHAFIERLVTEIPGLRESLEQHLRDDRGQLLPYVFMDGYAWPWFLEHFRSADEADRAEALRYLDALERELGSEDMDTKNLIGIGFVEWLENPGHDDIRRYLPSRLRRWVAASGHEPTR